MAKGRKALAILNTNNYVLTFDCGEQIEGAPRLLVLREKLHKKKCPICNKVGTPATTVDEFDKSRPLKSVSLTDLNKNKNIKNFNHINH